MNVLDISAEEELSGSCYLDYDARLMSFFSRPWRKSVSPAQLAASGFKFTAYRDVVKCVFCQIQLGEWGAGDDPDTDHVRESPHCPFMRFKRIPVIASLFRQGYKEEAIMRAHDAFLTTVTEEQLKAHLADIKVSDRSDPRCKVCMEKNCNILFLPCRHLVTCSDCAHRLTNCCVCAGAISSSMPVYT